MKVFFSVLGVLVALLLVGWIAEGNNFFLYKVFAPRYEAVRRQTYEQTKSYKQGSIQRLGTLCLQVDKSDEDHAVMVQAVIAQEFEDWNSADLPIHLRSCLLNARDRNGR